MGSSPKSRGQTAGQKELERYQLEDIRELRDAESKRKTALQRGRLGRASLLTGSRRGIVEGEERLQKQIKPAQQGDANVVAASKSKARNTVGQAIAKHKKKTLFDRLKGPL